MSADKIKRNYQKISFNRLARLDYRLSFYIRKAENNQSLKRRVHAKYNEFLKLRKRFLLLNILKVICFLFIYVSVISLVVEDITYLSYFTQRLGDITGLIGIPVFTIFLVILEKISNAFFADAYFLSSEIINMVKK